MNDNTKTKTTLSEVIELFKKHLRDEYPFWRRVDISDYTGMTDMFEKEIVIQALERTKGNQVKACVGMGIKRSTLRDRMVKHNVIRKDFVKR